MKKITARQAFSVYVRTSAPGRLTGSAREYANERRLHAEVIAKAKQLSAAAGRQFVTTADLENAK